jgi:quercetin dioxygenase-like cupin family protein
VGRRRRPAARLNGTGPALALGRKCCAKVTDGAGVVAFSLPAIAQDTPMRVTPDALTWKENSAFPKGVQIATLVGDPTKAGDVVVLRIKFPPNFQMPPHTHPYSEVVTIISGNIGTSHGEKFEKKGELLKPGSLWVYPAKHAHFAWTGNEAMKREDRPMMEEERPMVESVTSPAAPYNVLDRRNRLCCERRGPGRSNQCLGVIRYEESCRKDCRRRDGSESELTHLCLLRVSCRPFRAFRTSEISLFIFSKRALPTAPWGRPELVLAECAQLRHEVAVRREGSGRGWYQELER